MKKKPATQLEALEKRLMYVISIEGVQPAALDQPRINAYVRIPGDAVPMSTELGFGNETSFNIQAFYDTGASGVLLSLQTAGLLSTPQQEGVPLQMHNGEEVIFSDIGVAGAEEFYVSQPLDIGLAPFNQGDGDLDLDNEQSYTSVYNQVFGPIRTQIGPPDAPANPLLEGLDVLGTPVMENKVVVFDPKPVNTFFDTMRSYVYNPGTPWHPSTEETDPGIVPVSHHVALSYADFERFTKVTPAGAPGPTLRSNPFIGPNPILALDGLPPDGTPPVTMTQGSSTATGSFLLDTGAAASILSTNRANALGVRYRAGTYGTDNPILETFDGTTLPDQYQLSIGGIGGTIKLAGWYMDSMTIQTVEGEPIEFIGAPVLVGDISALDDKGTPGTGDDQTITLDGIFGVNFLVASCYLSEGAPGEFPIIDNLTVNAFDWFTYDQVNGTLGLALANPSPNPRVVDELFDVDGSEQAFYVQFSRDVGASLSNTDLQLTNLSTNFTLPAGSIAQAWEVQLNTATFSFPGYPEGYLPDGNYRATIAANAVSDGSLNMEADYVHDFFFLNGDATRDRKVDTRDFNVLAANFGAFSGATFTQGDFNYDASIDSLDFTKFLQQYGKTLPAPLAAPSLALPEDKTFVLATTDGRTSLRPTPFLSPGLQLTPPETATPTTPLSLLAATSLFSQTPLKNDLRDEILA